MIKTIEDLKNAYLSTIQRNRIGLLIAATIFLLIAIVMLLFFNNELRIEFNFGPSFSLIEPALISISISAVIIIYVTYVSYIFEIINKNNSNNHLSECPWNNVINDDIKEKMKLGLPGENGFCQTINCPLYPPKDGELCKIRLQNLGP